MQNFRKIWYLILEKNELIVETCIEIVLISMEGPIESQYCGEMLNLHSELSINFALHRNHCKVTADFKFSARFSKFNKLLL